MDSKARAVAKGRTRTVSRQHLPDLVALHMRLPRPIVEATKSCAAARGISMAAVITEAARQYLAALGLQSPEDVRDALIARHLNRLMSKQKTLQSQQRVMVETLGVLSQLLLGSLPMPMSPPEQERYDHQVARCYPKFIAAVAKSVSPTESSFLRSTSLESVASREDFPDLPPAGAPAMAVSR